MYNEKIFENVTVWVKWKYHDSPVSSLLSNQYLLGDYHNVVTNNFNGSSYDFIIGENSQTYCPRECWGCQILADQLPLYYFDFCQKHLCKCCGRNSRWKLKLHNILVKRILEAFSMVNVFLTFTVHIFIILLFIIYFSFKNSYICNLFLTSFK